MESPVKKIDFSSPTTQNNGELKAVPLVGLPELPPIASEILDKKETADDEEPILKENPNRFVLFPIKFHEVREFDASTTRHHAKILGRLTEDHLN